MSAPMKPLTFAIADDHVLFRKGLVSLLKGFKGVEVLYEADNGRQLIDGMATRQPDLAIVDVEMPEMDGVETTRQLRAHYPGVKILIISMHDDEDLILNLLEEGAHGYLLKNADPAEVRKALEDVMDLQQHGGGGVAQCHPPEAPGGPAERSAQPKRTRMCSICLCSNTPTPR